jgi:RimJ/RimL family protein N-acetyltransferase
MNLERGSEARQADVSVEALGPDYFGITATWLSQPEVNRWLTAEWRDRLVEPRLVAVAARNSRNRLFLARVSGMPCGVVGLSDLDTVDHLGMIWYALGASSLRGRGVMSEAVRLVVRLGFEELGLECVYAWTMADNVSSQRVLIKTGFREVGRFRQSALSRGVRVDRIYYDIIPTDTTPPRCTTKHSVVPRQ